MSLKKICIIDYYIFKKSTYNSDNPINEIEWLIVKQINLYVDGWQEERITKEKKGDNFIKGKGRVVE